MIKLKDFLFSLFKVESKSSCQDSLDYKNSELGTMDLRLEECKKDLSECRRQKEEVIKDLIIANKEVLSLRNTPFESAKLPPPKVLRTLTKGSITRILQGMYSECQIYCSDEKYSLVSKESIQKFLMDTKVNRENYKEESGDCDNFSVELLAEFMKWGRQLDYQLAVGEIWVDMLKGKHALNLVFCWDEIHNKSEVYFIEPQTDKIFKDESYKAFFVRC